MKIFYIIKIEFLKNSFEKEILFIYKKKII